MKDPLFDSKLLIDKLCAVRALVLVGDLGPQRSDRFLWVVHPDVPKTSNPSYNLMRFSSQLLVPQFHYEYGILYLNHQAMQFQAPLVTTPTLQQSTSLPYLRRELLDDIKISGAT